jgi:hypothetical protein
MPDPRPSGPPAAARDRRPASHTCGVCKRSLPRPQPHPHKLGPRKHRCADQGPRRRLERDVEAAFEEWRRIKRDAD